MKKSEIFRQYCVENNVVEVRTLDAAKQQIIEKVNKIESATSEKDIDRLCAIAERYAGVCLKTSVAANIRHLFHALGNDVQGISIWEKCTLLKHDEAVLKQLQAGDNLTKFYVGLKIGSIWKESFRFSYYKWEKWNGKNFVLTFGIPKDIDDKDDNWKKNHAYTELVPISKVDESDASSLWREELLTGMVRYEKPIFCREILKFIRMNLDALGITSDMYVDNSLFVRTHQPIEQPKEKVNKKTGEVKAC